MLTTPYTHCDPEKTTLVLSDIHIGRKYSNWKQAVQLMINYNWKRIIICGDFHDTWYSPLAMIAVLFSTALKSAAKKIIYVTGNHDDELTDSLLTNEPFELITESYSPTIGGKKFVFIHGHQVDKFNSKHSWIGWLLTKFQAFVHRVTKIDTHKFTSGVLFRIMARKQRKQLIEKYHEKCDVLVYGHTHKPLHETIETNGKQLEIFNTGDWVRNNTYLVIDENGEVKRYSEK